MAKHHHKAFIMIAIFAGCAAQAVISNRSYHGWWVWPDVAGAVVIALVGVYMTLHALFQAALDQASQAHEAIYGP